MSRSYRSVCVAASLVPATFVWLSMQRVAQFRELMGHYLGSPRYEWVTPLSDFVFKTIQFWPSVAVLAWGLVIPAMFGRPWCLKLRLALTCCFLAVGPLLYGVCLEGLNHSQMCVLRVWDENRAEVQVQMREFRQQQGGGYSPPAARSAQPTP